MQHVRNESVFVFQDSHFDSCCTGRREEGRGAAGRREHRRARGAGRVAQPQRDPRRGHGLRRAGAAPQDPARRAPGVPVRVAAVREEGHACRAQRRVQELSHLATIGLRS